MISLHVLYFFAGSHGKRNVFSITCGSELGGLTTRRTSPFFPTDSIKAAKHSTYKATGGNDWKTSQYIFSTSTRASTSFAFPSALTTKNAKVLPTSGLIIV